MTLATEAAFSEPVGRAARGDFLGAANGAASCITGTVACATLVFAPLGPQWLGQGLVACLVASILGGLVAAALSSTPVTISSPRAAATIVLALLVATLHGASPSVPPRIVVMLAAFAVLLAGLLQLAAGLVRLGQLVRFVPFPVIAGFTHGIAFALIAIYVPLLLGMTQVPKLQWPQGAPVVPGAALLGLFTFAVVVLCSRPARLRLPGLFLGLVAGLALYAVVETLAPGTNAGTLLRTESLPAPQLAFADWEPFAAALREPAIWRDVISFAIAIAVVASVDSLVGVMAVETRHGVRSRPDRDLVAQGSGNVLSGLLGGAAISYGTVQVLSAYAGGARGRMAGITAPFFVLAFALAAIYAAAAIPLAVLAALMIVVAARLADPWPFALMRIAVRLRGRANPALWYSLLVYLAVALSVVLLGILMALAIGITISAVIFLRTVNQHVVRRVLSGASVRSRRLFPRAVSQALATGMQHVAVIEVQGPLFFGTADRIVEETTRLSPAIRYVVLDMRRVQALDETALAVMTRLSARLRSERREFVLSGRPPGLSDIAGALPRRFEDRDRAMEWIEERLLEDAGIAPQADRLEPAALAQLLRLDERGEQVLRKHCRVVDLAAGDTIFRGGDASAELYFLLAGRVSIYYGENGINLRVVSFLPGNVFGDVAFVDGQPRSADAMCDIASQVLVLDREGLARIEAEAPSLVVRLYEALANDIAGRLRAADRIVKEVL